MKTSKNHAKEDNEYYDIVANCTKQYILVGVERTNQIITANENLILRERNHD